ncbi:hypothetical protein RBE51_20230 [Pseudomonas taiwanensis]|uniref:hypothetical protein n=1 Tax=Pseudomonas taiwanensis TaxID=470150 RepID=UPI0028DF557B|nr:hypothetical protein [Pseudomonas taiwanensis]MDT8925122.1 hypothetical protein [Pseudomonas taiwanensis]
MTYIVLTNGLACLNPDDFRFTDPILENAAPGFRLEQMLNGFIQHQAQRSLRAFANAHASLEQIFSGMELKAPNLTSVGYKPDEVPLSRKDIEDRQDEIVGMNLAMALSIPAPDYERLLAYTDFICQGDAGKNVKQVMEDASFPLQDYNLLNLYKILRSRPTEKWCAGATNPSYHKMELLRLAIACDDPGMTRRLECLFYDNDKIDIEVAELLAETPFDALSQVRFEHSCGKSMLMSEVRARIRLQLAVFEDQPSLYTVRVPVESARRGDEPDIGYANEESFRKPLIDRALHHIPRYQEYLAQNTQAVMIDLCTTLNRARAPACHARKTVISQLLTDLQTHGITFKELVIKGIRGKSAAEYVDRLDQPGGGYIDCIRDLLQERHLNEYPLKAFLISELCKQLPVEDILMAARNDQELSSAHKATGNPIFLEHLSSLGIESHLSESLGL